MIRKKDGLNILILHAHWNNRGDEAAIRAMIDSLRENLPIKSIKIMILSDDITYFPYKDIEVLDMFPKIQKRHPMTILLGGIDILISLFSSANLAVSRGGKRFISAVKDSDIVLHAPGGPNIGDIYSGRYGTPEIYYLYRLIIPIIKRKPVFFYAPSIGPFSKKYRNILRKFVLKKASEIIVRDETSSIYLKTKLFLDSHVTTDCALQNDIPEDYLKKISNISGMMGIIQTRKIVGMTITDLSWHPVYSKYPGLGDRIIQSMSEVIRFLIDKSYYIILIPQIFGNIDKVGNSGKEINLLEFIQKINKEEIFIIPYDLDAYAQQIIISKLFCLIGMRHHANIFAAKANVPNIAISYEFKSIGFMEQIGLQDLTINVNEISAIKVIEKFMYLETNYNIIQNQLKNRIPKIKEISQKTTDIITNKVYELGLI